MPKPIRIQKLLSDSGILSRRKTEEYIAAGRITVNGRKAEPGQPALPTDVIAIDGIRVRLEQNKENLYIMLNKPRGYVTTTSDELGRRCVTQLVEDLDARVYPVGRLDRDSEGLLLLTNDGQFANLIMHPSHHIGKTYRVTVRPGITEEQCVALSTGVDIGKDGEVEMTAPATVLVLEKYPDRAVVQITITQGKNRQVRRMCEALGLTVARLKRTAIGPLRLGMLPPGEWRELKKSELIALRNSGGGAAAQAAPEAPEAPPAREKKKPARDKAAPKTKPGPAKGGAPASKAKPGSAKGGTPGPKPGPRPAKGKAPAGKASAPKKPGPKRAGEEGMSRDRSGGLRFRSPDKPRRGGKGGGRR